MRKLIFILALLIVESLPAFGAAAIKLNGATFSAWNGATLGAWDGTTNVIAGGGGGDTAWVTSNPAGTTRSDFDGCVGAKFTPASGLTVSSLGLWVVSGNSASVTVTIKNDSDGTLMGTATFATGSLSPGWNYISVTPFSLTGATQYAIGRNVSSGGDAWVDVFTPTVTGAATCDHSSYNTDCTTYPTTGADPNKMFAGVNFKYH